MKKIIFMCIICGLLLTFTFACGSSQESQESQEFKNSNSIFQKIETESKKNECASWEEIINIPEYQKLLIVSRLELKKRYFNLCILKNKNIDSDSYYKDKFYNFFMSTLEAEKKAGLISYNCISGDCNNGEGKLGYYSFINYEGKFKDGKRDGEGTMTYQDGAKYVGQWKDNLKNGVGTITYQDGAKYVGHWKDGLRNGTGTMTYSYSVKYVGQWQNGKRHGTGTLTDGDKKYEGQWKDDKRDGNGTYTYSWNHDGNYMYGSSSGNEKYIGQWKEDKYHGKGIYTYYEKYTSKNYVSGYTEKGYDGQWENGLEHGTGTKTYEDGKKYVGQFKTGKKHGKGTLYDSDGKILHKGTFLEDEYIGQ